MRKILFICMLFCLASCESWLDVSPKSQVKNEDMFSNESGFQTAMFGVYTSMASSMLYGSELSMGFMDVLARYYEVPTTQNYYRAYAYDYTSSFVVNYSERFWQDMYKTIMNCNYLLENIEGKEDLFSRGHYPVMKGEMLGVRAYLHFDLLRMYAPSFAEGKTLPAIPYVDRLSRTPFPQLTVEEVTERIIKDCRAALDLLKDSEPWVLQGTDRFTDHFFENRRERMNYYAVQALLARVCLYAGNTTEAGKISDELIKTKGLGVTNPLFSIYSDKTPDRVNSFFAMHSDGIEVFTVKDTRREELFEATKYNMDNRVIKWFNLKSGSTSVYLVTKYAGAVTLPLIRMNEVYYISAECCQDEETALGFLNQVRNDYGIPSQLDLKAGQCVFADELQKEYRKSFMGEGQFFYFLKRRDAKQIPLAAEIENPRKVYTLPMPEGELEFGDLIEQ